MFLELFRDMMEANDLICFKMITDYLVAMKAKQAGHATTAKEEADLETVKAEGKKYDYLYLKPQYFSLYLGMRK